MMCEKWLSCICRLVFQIYADLPGYLSSVSPRSTIPTNLSTTLSRHDLVLISDNSIYLFEPTIPTNTQQHLLAARARKEDRYNEFFIAGSSAHWFCCWSHYHWNRLSGSIYAWDHFSSGQSLSGSKEICAGIVWAGIVWARCSYCCFLLL